MTGTLFHLAGFEKSLLGDEGYGLGDGQGYGYAFLIKYGEDFGIGSGDGIGYENGFGCGYPKGNGFGAAFFYAYFAGGHGDGRHFGYGDKD